MFGVIIKIAKMKLKEYTIYRLLFFLFTFNRIVELLVYIFVWQAIYSQVNNTEGFSLAQMITYYILVFTFSSIATWGINDDMAHSIRNRKY